MYNALETKSTFPDIDPAFVPLRQMSANEKVHTVNLLSYDFKPILAVQDAVSPPPEKQLA